jgi:uncharacterized membrane protein YhdT
MNSISDIMKGGVSAILIGLGYVLVWCGIFCLIGSATGMADKPAEILWCGVGCLVMGAIQMVSGIVWYYIVKSKA